MDKIIGLDIGKKRIGIAMSDVMGLIAHPVETIQREPESIAIEKIKKICKENNIKKIVINLDLFLLFILLVVMINGMFISIVYIPKLH